MMKVFWIFFFTFVFVLSIFAQEKKTLEALKISNPLTIDGILDEPFYSQIAPAKDFVQLQPYNGKPSFQPTEVYIFYDQDAVYVGAMLYDSSPDSIFNYLSERDNIGMSDYFGIYLDPYNQGQVAYGFFITPAGVQTDLKAVKSDYDYEDSNWNAVWESMTRMTDKGWALELRIPYSALRFSGSVENVWGLNMFRNIRRYSSNNSWNFVDRNVNGFIHQQGQLIGINDIKPPVRLSLSPYVASYFERKKDGKVDFLYKGGMDLKYGISESVTLDMMLIPDFGQVQSDDKKLNLSPYEMYYDEKRQFFTEGTEMFQKGSVFYSRRIGASPKFNAEDMKESNEVVDFKPNETQLYNATKISGRSKNGFGIGFLNAVSVESRATMKDTISGETRDVVVQPVTNYNVTVIDQSLKNNSYISLINTNVKMADNPFYANVTATEFNIRDKSKTFSLKGKGGLSVRDNSSKEDGFFTNLGLEKNKGKWQYAVTQYIYSDKYNPNDLGYLQKNNQIISEAWVYFQNIEPFGIVREYNWNLWYDYVRVFNPNTFCYHQGGGYMNVTFTNNYSFNFNSALVSEQFNYDEPRVKGRFYHTPPYYYYNFNLNTDDRKLLSFYFHYGHTDEPFDQYFADFGDFQANMRIGQRASVYYGLGVNLVANVHGYVDHYANDDSIVFARRDVNTITNVLSCSYVLNNKMSVNCRARHYWSGAKNKMFYLLMDDGSLAFNPSYTKNKDKNYNTFTVDMNFRWIFAPGSELVFAWKSSSDVENEIVRMDYFDNLGNLWNDQANSLSLKVLYYIDYNSLKRKNK
ncbi:MAG TPA: DUF5916 domain-containing protein [Bacteroidales bacterium]|nr:DUF5916 domain-containing protein [Bacteroidales bacterium]